MSDLADHSVLKFDYKFNVEKYKTDDKFQLDKGRYDQLIDYLNINWDEMLESPAKLSMKTGKILSQFCLKV